VRTRRTRQSGSLLQRATRSGYLGDRGGAEQGWSTEFTSRYEANGMAAAGALSGGVGGAGQPTRAAVKGARLSLRPAPCRTNQPVFCVHPRTDSADRHHSSGGWSGHVSGRSAALLQQRCHGRGHEAVGSRVSSGSGSGWSAHPHGRSSSETGRAVGAPPVLNWVSLPHGRVAGLRGVRPPPAEISSRS
jgi:hypothetical protein